MPRPLLFLLLGIASACVRRDVTFVRIGKAHEAEVK